MLHWFFRYNLTIPAVMELYITSSNYTYSRGNSNVTISLSFHGNVRGESSTASLHVASQEYCMCKSCDELAGMKPLQMKQTL